VFINDVFMNIEEIAINRKRSVAGGDCGEIFLGSGKDFRFGSGE